MAVSDAEMRVAEQPTEPLEPHPIEDPYRDWTAREGVKVIEEFAFEDLNALELGPWERKGGSGVISNIPYNHVVNDAQVIEIAAGGKSEPEHHFYEEMTYVLSGTGTTTIWVEGGEKHTFEWGEGTAFSIPLNAWYQHFNASGRAPARYLSVTNAPPMMRLFSDDDLIFNTPWTFKNRFQGQGDEFTGDGQLFQHQYRKGLGEKVVSSRRVWRSNFIPNAQDMGLYGWKERGAGGINVMLELARNHMAAHISEFPVGTYKKAHRHGPGAHLIIMSGEGFSALWSKDDMSDLVKAPWKKHGLVVIPYDNCTHQHFNTGTSRARYLVFSGSTMGTFVPAGMGAAADVSIKDGGMQVEYEDEDPRIHEMFEEEVAKHGQECLMKAFIPWCNGSVGPTDERLT